MKNSFAIAYYCRQSKLGKKGVAPVEMSISINGKRSFVALPKKMEPVEFNKLYNTKRNNELKTFLKNYERMVDEAIEYFTEKRKPITVDAIKNYIASGGDKTTLLSTVFKEYLDLVARKNVTLCTYQKYTMAFDRFIKQVGDKPIEEVKNGDILHFVANLNKEYSKATVRSYALKLKTAFIYARQNDYLKGNPWVGVKVERPTTKVDTISEEEFEKIASKRFDNERLEKVRKMFLLSCCTGMAFSDIQNLKPSDIQERDGKLFVEKERCKTGVTFCTVITGVGREIIEEMQGDFSQLRLSGQKCNAYLKEIGDLCGIKISLHFHLARHYAITHLLRIGMPPQIVQKVAGHSSLAMQKVYSHLVQNDVLAAFN